MGETNMSDNEKDERVESPASGDEQDDEQEYVIECILEHKPATALKPSKVKKYLVKWEGYGDDENSLEPAASIKEQAAAAVNTYWSKVRAGRKGEVTISPKRKPTKKSNKKEKASASPVRESNRKRKSVDYAAMNNADEPETDEDEIVPARKSSKPEIGSFQYHVSQLEKCHDKDRKFLKKLAEHRDMPAALVKQIDKHLNN